MELWNSIVIATFISGAFTLAGIWISKKQPSSMARRLEKKCEQLEKDLETERDTRAELGLSVEHLNREVIRLEAIIEVKDEFISQLLDKLQKGK